MRKKLLLSFLLMCMSLVAAGQVPGFLGRRLYVKAYCAPELLITGPSANNRGARSFAEQHRGWGFASQLGLEAGYAVSRRGAIALTLGRLNKAGAIINQYATPSAFSFVGPFVYDTHDLFLHSTGQLYRLDYLVFRRKKGFTAPAGNYIGIHFQHIRTQSSVVDKRTTFAVNYPNLQHAPLGIGDFIRKNYSGLGMSVGAHHIAGKRFLYGASAELTLSSQYLLAFLRADARYFKDMDLQGAFTPEAYAYDFEAYNSRLLDSNLLGRMARRSLLGVKFFAGYLL